jgi:hypothetical protein
MAERDYRKIGTLGEKILESGVLDQLKLKDAPSKKKNNWKKFKKKEAK